MKDKKTLITIIVLLVIILPMGIYGTIKNFNTGKTETKDDNPNKEFIYNNKLYFYYENELLATYECSTCNNASNEIDDVKDRLMEFRGIGEHKADTAIIVLGIYTGNNGLNNVFDAKCMELYKTIGQEIQILDRLGDVEFDR